MKVLSVIRHAKASKDDPDLRDFDRPLDERGMRDAPRMGREMSRRRPCPDLIVSSPALRALTTARLIAAELGLPGNHILTDGRIYHADGPVLLSVAAGIADKCGHAALVGHNPALLDFVNMVSREPIAELPTCAVVRLELRIESWSDIAPHSARLAECLHPDS